MGAELLAAVALAALATSALTLVGLGLVVVAWGATALVAVPLHTKLSRGFARDAHAALLRANWLRTLVWSARTGLAVALL